MAPDSKWKLGSRAMHADDVLHTGAEVAPSISVSTTFKHPHPDLRNTGDIAEFDPTNPKRHVYSRYATPTLLRLEAVLSSVIGQPTIAYSTGLTAGFAVLEHFKPDVIAISHGYYGIHQVIAKYKGLRGNDDVKVISLSDPFTHPKTLAWVETPLNPTGEVRDLAYYRKKLPKDGILVVDSTLAPPPLSDPFKFGADVVMHSGTKYFAGHSDALLGTVSVRDLDTWRALWDTRTFLGLVPGSMEQWLVLRSLRTIHLRVPRQAETATKLAKWLKARPEFEKVFHATLQDDAKELVGKGKQQESGPATFAVLTRSEYVAKHLQHELKLFTPATSLGGVESLIEQRALSSPGENPRIIRLSIGVEDVEDLIADMEQALNKLALKAKL